MLAQVQFGAPSAAGLGASAQGGTFAELAAGSASARPQPGGMCVRRWPCWPLGAEAARGADRRTAPASPRPPVPARGRARALPLPAGTRPRSRAAGQPGARSPGIRPGPRPASAGASPDSRPSFSASTQTAPSPTSAITVTSGARACLSRLTPRTQPPPASRSELFLVAVAAVAVPVADWQLPPGHLLELGLQAGLVLLDHQDVEAFLRH
jgi:hypothetical protein